MTINENASGAAGTGETFNVGANDQFVKDYSTYDVIDQFRQAMQAAGISFSGEIIPDGKLQRFYIEGHKRGSRNGAYTLHADNCPAGWFMNHKSGLAQIWRMSSAADMAMSYKMKAEIDKAKRERAKETLQKHAAAAEKARYYWQASKLITSQSEHAYLVKKRIQPYGARLYRESLVIPLKNAEKKTVNLQFISPEGEKRFLSGGRKKGCFYPIGQPTPRILICEGFATGASLHENSDHCTVVAFDAGNLLPVAKVIRTMFPANEIIICGDNDESGVGQAKARDAALAIGGKVLIPKIAGMDWNDVISGGRQNG